MLFPPPGAPSIRHILPGGDDGGFGDCCGDEKRSTKLIDSF